MKVLVVGGAGFIGYHLCEALLKKEINVICVDNMSIETENMSYLINRSNFTFYKADASSIYELKNIFQNENPDIVFHLAANSDIKSSAEKPEIEYKNTYSTTYAILTCMKESRIKSCFLLRHLLFMEIKEGFY